MGRLKGPRVGWDSPLINRTSRSCLGKDLRGRLVLRSRRGVSGVLGLARRELERRARALWSLCRGWSQLLRFWFAHGIIVKTQCAR